MWFSNYEYSLPQRLGKKFTTVEGIALSGTQLHPVQEAFVEHGALQCGFCTPGMVVSAVHILERHGHPSEAEIRHGLAGNLCRCTGYTKIVQAIKAVADQDEGGEA